MNPFELKFAKKWDSASVHHDFDTQPEQTVNDLRIICGRLNDQTPNMDEICLWRAVILNAIEDALFWRRTAFVAGRLPPYFNATDNELRNAVVARQWFQNADLGFETICEAARLSSSAVRRSVLSEIATFDAAHKPRRHVWPCKRGKARRPRLNPTPIDKDWSIFA